ncbi:hypothetical protein HZF08_29990 [Paenibacillus sp. CGMCC 1.16610]|uniref:Uncharacterized protein n=1 Tax=Paenibacillus anseongense TaxID=2682845 RepID=A0ABW9U834_9BACL|nr:MULTISPECIES: hypothetical protein [Paenibacillus]MBA2942510.1 hypothetical protein [Paenibacillus sp. CGMCC 1.16610]MVQ35324.1 hypothetical protein [Paenibacillus anseongense]
MQSHVQSGKIVQHNAPTVTASNSSSTLENVSVGRHPKAMSPAQMMHLQRTIGNRSVAELFKQHSKVTKAVEKPDETIATADSIQAAPSATQADIQRKVYIKRTLFGGYRNKSKSGRGSEGSGERNVKTMMEDNKSRYFNSKNEMSQYAANTTEKIGYVEKTSTWIRIPNELTVIGEKHTATTLHDVVKAVGTDKFMYEGYTEHPAEADDNPELQANMRQRDAIGDAKFGGVGTGPGTKSHYAESFYPKIIRGMQGLKVRHDYQIMGSEAEKNLLGMAIRFAASAEEDSGLYQTYSAQEDLWRNTATSLEGDNKSAAPLVDAMLTAGSSNLFTTFVQELTEYATMKIQEEQARASAADKSAFEANWHMAKVDYDVEGSEIMKAEKARDFSMFQHIKKAKSDGYLLYGLGDLHLKRIKELLDAEGIKSVDMNTFISNQETTHPQR